MRADRFLILVCAAGTAACASAPAPAPVPVPNGEASFTFREWLAPATPSLLSGRVTVAGESIFVETKPGPCRLLDGSTEGAVVDYECAGVRLRFHRTESGIIATYDAVVSTPEVQQTCVNRSYAPDGGGYTCAQVTRSFTSRTEPKTGRLRLLPES